MRFEGTQLAFERSAEGVLEVRLHREPASEIGLAMLGELERVAEAVRAPGVRAMVLHGATRRGFCAGADLRELHHENARRKREGASTSDRAREVRAFLDRIHACFDAIDEAPCTTVAAVHGVCFGGGFELALTCDVVVADRTARFCFPELRLGLVPGFGGIPRLERDVGNAVIRDLLLTGRSLGAARAHELGLVSQLVAPGEHVAVARRVAEQARRFDARAAAAAKAFLKPIPKERLAREKDLFCELFESPVVEQALARFDADTTAMPYLPASPTE
jgi:enoyl-CoA hydratase